MWQGFLERSFPGRHTLAPEVESLEFAERGGHGAHAGLLEKEDDPPEERPREGRLNWRNTITKWFVDCMTVGAIMNTVAFLVLMGVLKGKGAGEIGGSIRVVGVSALNSPFLRRCSLSVVGGVSRADFGVVGIGDYPYHCGGVQDLADCFDYQFQPYPGGEADRLLELCGAVVGDIYEPGCGKDLSGQGMPWVCLWRS